MSKTYNSPQTFKEFVSNPNSYTSVSIAPYSMDLNNEQKKRIAEVLETNETVTALLCSIEDESMEDEMAEAFTKMLKNNKTITKFDLNTADYQKLAEGIKENTTIKELSLDCSQGSPNIEAIKAIALALEHHKTISSVELCSLKELTNDKILVFTDSLKKNKTVTDVTILVFGNNEITEAGIQHIYNMLDSNPRIITGRFHITPDEGMQESEKASFLSTLDSCKEKLKYNLEKLKKLANFVNDNLKSFTGKFDPTSNPEHPSVLKFYQQSNKDSLSKMLKAVNPAINPKNVLNKINSYMEHDGNWLTLSGVCKNLQPENNSDTKCFLNEDVMSVIGKYVDLNDIAN